MKKIYVLTILILLGYSSVAQIIVDFQANHTTPTPDLIVTFTPTLISSDVNYFWSFSPTTVTYVNGTNSESELPEVKFNEFKKYTVTLTLTGGFGTSTITKNDYIKVRPEYEIGLSFDEVSEMYINVQMRANSGIPPSASNKISKIEFGIMWIKDIVPGNKLDLDLACSDVNPYRLMQEEHGLPWNVQNWDYRNFVAIDPTDEFKPPNEDQTDWESGEWVTILQLKIFPRNGNGGNNIADSGNFAIVPNKEHFNKAMDPVIKLSGVNNFVNVLPEGDPMNNPTFIIPTPIPGYVWVGGNGINSDMDDYSWNHGPNWKNGCGGEGDFAEIPPGIYDDVLIPNVDNFSNCYPRYTSHDNPSQDTATGQDILVSSGGKIEWMNGLTSYDDEVFLQTYGYLNIDALSEVSVYSEGRIDIGGDTAGWVANLKIFGTGGLKIKDGGKVNAKYRTTIKAEEGLLIEANENGVGSFINTGKILYENGGTAKVQTFISGKANVYHMHFAGPTVKDVSYTNLTGARLEQFNMTTLDTYAYEWRPDLDINIEEPEPHVYYCWENVWLFEHNVKVADGLAITNYEAGDGTMNMIGFLNADTANPIQYQVFCADSSIIDNQLELLSNPFSSAISFDDFYEYENNSDYIFGKYKIWYDTIGNYVDYIVGLDPDNEYIQVGQGFFVETKLIGTGTLEFPVSIRNHSNVAFRELDIMNLTLGMDVTGENSYKDRLTIYFTNDATSYYDEELEAKKWNSIREDATMIRSIADDGTELAINALDEKKYYQEEVVSVPVHFQCGYNGTYTFDFSGIESFDPGSEIWLEDRKINQNNSYDRSSMQITEDNHIYSFTASPDDAHDRFIIHFFGPSYLPNAVDENSVAEKIKIYSSGNSVYILNNSNQELKELSVYNMLGQEILRSKIPAQDLNKIDVNTSTGYYAVKVLTDKNIYSEKLFIKAY